MLPKITAEMRPKPPLEVLAVTAHLLFHGGTRLVDLGQTAQQQLESTKYAVDDEAVTRFNYLLACRLVPDGGVLGVCTALNELEDLSRNLN